MISLRGALSAMPFLLALNVQAETLLPESQIKFICSAQLSAKVRNSVLRPEWIREPAEFSDDALFKSPTDTVGVWLELRQSASQIFLSRNTASSRDVLKFTAASCAGEKWSKKFDDETRANSFNDGALAAALKDSRARGSSGVIYIWSPHMLYSPLGLHEIQQFAKKRKLTVIGLVDPSADESFSKSVAKNYELRDADLLRADSYELKERGFRIHYPSMIVFKKGKIVSMAIPGYNAEEKLQRILSRYL